MRGWIIVDGLIGIGGFSGILSGLTTSPGIWALTVVAWSLLALTLVTRAVRGRA